MKKILSIIILLFINLNLIGALPEIKFDEFPKVRNVSDVKLGKILQDIDSHMPAGHRYIFANKLTWGHETTHGINATIRNQYKGPDVVNAFYCLYDRAVIIEEPAVTIRAVAATIPVSLRGPSYNLYLVQQAGGWNNRPLYLFDEWVAYTNGSEGGRELNYEGWYYELLQAHNFNVYCICLAKLVSEKCPYYNDNQFRAFLKWNIERTFRLTEKFDNKQKVTKEVEDSVKIDYRIEGEWGSDSDPVNSALSYVKKVRESSDAEELRAFARKYFGKEWCKKVYGF